MSRSFSGVEIHNDLVGFVEEIIKTEEKRETMRMQRK